MLLLDKIRKSFSDSAIQHDVFSVLQREIGRDLIAKVKDVTEVNRILDIGMGTGRMTNRLSFVFTESDIIGIDIADGMVAQAISKYPHLTFLQANACQLPFKRSSFDIIISNLVYQWLPDLEIGLKEAFRTLKSNGTFAFTMFGFETLKELNESISKAVFNYSPKTSSIVKPLPKKEDVALILERIGFKDIKVSTEKIVVHFENMMGLLKWLKDTGANGGRKTSFIGRDRLFSADDYYNSHFKDSLGVRATFEVIWVKTRKR